MFFNDNFRHKTRFKISCSFSKFFSFFYHKKDWPKRLSTSNFILNFDGGLHLACLALLVQALSTKTASSLASFSSLEVKSPRVSTNRMSPVWSDVCVKALTIGCPPLRFTKFPNVGSGFSTSLYSKVLKSKLISAGADTRRWRAVKVSADAEGGMETLLATTRRILTVIFQDYIIFVRNWKITEK